MTYHLNIFDCFLNGYVHVDYHSTCTPPWIVDVVGDMVAETFADPLCFPPYVDSLFAGDVERNKCSNDAGHSCP